MELQSLPVKAKPYRHQCEAYRLACDLFGLDGEARSRGAALLTGGAAGMTLTAAYAEITEIIKAEKRIAKHPFEVGERFTAKRITYDDPNSHKSTTTMIEYEIVKRSDTTIQLKVIGTDNKPITRKPRQRWNGAWMFSIDDRTGNTFSKAKEATE